MTTWSATGFSGVGISRAIGVWLRRKDEIIAEIMEDLVRTKKELGES
jgi:hypothetical protein